MQGVVSPVSRAHRFRRFLDTRIFLSTVATIYLAAAGAHAEAPAGDIQEVVVSGYRESLDKALANKRNSDLPIESVAPEDIGKMPDQNVAESLQRLPGIQINRAGGQGTSVLIDGMRQNLTTLNGDIFLTGKEFYVSGVGASGGGGGNSQYNSLEGIPSEEIGGIDVYKNPKASITEGGLGGTINLKTRDPLLAPDGWSLGGNLRMTNSSASNDWTPVGTLVATYKFNDRLAVTGSVSYDEEDFHNKQVTDNLDSPWVTTNSATLPTSQPLTDAQYTTLPANVGMGGYYLDPQRAFFTDDYVNQKTIGASLGIGARITDSVKTRVNWFYTHLEAVQTDYTANAMFNSAGSPPGQEIPGIDPTKPYAIDGKGVVQYGTFTATNASTHTMYQDGVANANNLQWLTNIDPGGSLRGSIDASYAYATSNLQADQADVSHAAYATGGAVFSGNSISSGVLTSPAAPGCNNGAATCTPGTGNAPYQFAYSNGGTSGLPHVSNLASILNNSAYSTFQSNWAWANLTSQQQAAVKLDAEYDPAFIRNVDTTLSGGFRYATRNVGQTYGDYLINGTLPNGQVAGADGAPGGGVYDYYLDPGIGIPGVNVNIPYSTAASNPNLVKTVTNFATGAIQVKNPVTGGMTNPSTFLNTVFNQAGVPNNTEALFVDTLSSFRVKEHTTAGYLMGDVGGPENRFHLNFGVRVVQTNLTVNNAAQAPVPVYVGTDSWNGVNANNIPVTTNRSYTDILPSFNLVLDVSDSEKVRFGAARVVSPQDLFPLGLGDLYNYGRQTGARVNVHTGLQDGFAFEGGTSGNPHLDPYRATQGNISYENYFSRSGLVSVAGFWKQIDNFVEYENIPTFVMDDFGGTTADVNQPVNAGRGRIYGIEIGGQYAFDDRISPWLDGFGVAANYTLSASTSSQPTSFSLNAPIPGVSKNSLTGTVYYEKNGFSARLSYSWRDVALNDSAVGATYTLLDQNGNNKTYEIFSAPYGQLDGQVAYDINEHYGLVFSFQNLTDAAQHTYLQYPNQPFTYEDPGRRFFLGGKFKL